MRVQDLAISRKDLYMVSPSDLHEEPGWNVRIDSEERRAHVRTLADSIKQIGVQEALTCYVRGDILIITNGHCRLEAVRMAISEGAEIKAVPVRIEDRYANDADRTLSMITRNEGLPLSPVEKAEIVKRLLGYGWSKSAIAKKAGFSVSYVDFLLNLSALDPGITKKIMGGEISATMAIQVSQSVGAESSRDAVDKVIEKAKSNGRKKAKPRDFKNQEVTALANRLSVPVKCLVKKKGTYALVIQGLDEQAIENIVVAVRGTGFEF